MSRIEANTNQDGSVARRFSVVDKQTMFEDQWLKVLEYHIKRDGKDGTYAVVERKDSVAMVICDRQGSILLLRQFRFPTQQYYWEVPIGGVDDGESALAAATRELKEETGLVLPLKLVGTLNPAPGLSAQMVTLFTGTVSDEQAAAAAKFGRTSDEIVERRFFSFKEVVGKIADGEIQGYSLPVLARFMLA